MDHKYAVGQEVEVVRQASRYCGQRGKVVMQLGKNCYRVDLDSRSGMFFREDALGLPKKTAGAETSK